MRKTYRELKRLKTFEERFEYLKLTGVVGESTFGFDRYLNQRLYKSPRWLSVRDEVIVRDNGCDMGIKDREIYSKILVHHINPLTPEEIEFDDPCIYDPNNLICTSLDTHNAIHFGDNNLLPKGPVERKPNDQCPWLQ